MLKTNRGLLKFILLGGLTFGIYNLVVMSTLVNDVNTVCTPHDNKKSLNFWLVTLILSWLTCGIVPIVWMYNIYSRVGAELQRRGINYKISGMTFIGWNIFGMFFGFGPLVAVHKLVHAVNLICDAYNKENAAA